MFAGSDGPDPGSIFRVNGQTGHVPVFATLPENSGPRVGDVVFDKVSKHIYASDLDNGLRRAKIGEREPRRRQRESLLSLLYATPDWLTPNFVGTRSGHVPNTATAPSKLVVMLPPGMWSVTLRTTSLRARFSLEPCSLEATIYWEAFSMRRRQFLTAATSISAGSALSAALPAPAIAQSRKEMVVVSSWARDFPGVGTGAQRLARRVEEVSNDGFKVNYFAAGERVGAYDVFDAPSI